MYPRIRVGRKPVNVVTCLGHQPTVSPEAGELNRRSEVTVVLKLEECYTAPRFVEESTQAAFRYTVALCAAANVSSAAASFRGWLASRGGSRR